MYLYIWLELSELSNFGILEHVHMHVRVLRTYMIVPLRSSPIATRTSLEGRNRLPVDVIERVPEDDDFLDCEAPDQSSTTSTPAPA